MSRDSCVQVQFLPPTPLNPRPNGSGFLYVQLDNQSLAVMETHGSVLIAIEREAT